MSQRVPTSRRNDFRSLGLASSGPQWDRSFVSYLCIHARRFFLRDHLRQSQLAQWMQHRHRMETSAEMPWGCEEGDWVIHDLEVGYAIQCTHAFFIVYRSYLINLQHPQENRQC